MQASVSKIIRQTFKVQTATSAGQHITEKAQIQGRDSFVTASQTEAVTQQVPQTKRKGAAKLSYLNQTTALQAQKNVAGNSAFDLSRTTHTDVASQTKRDGNTTVTRTNVATETAQDLTRQSNVESNTDVHRSVTQRDAKGNIIGQNATHQTLDESTDVNLNQTLAATGNRDIVQETTVNKVQVGNYKERPSNKTPAMSVRTFGDKHRQPNGL